MQSAQVDIVIPFHDLIDWTTDCVRSILANSDESVRVILVDNASTESLPDHILCDPQVDVLANPENLGWAGGVNRGLDEVRAPLAVIMNNDILVPRGWLSTMASAVTQETEIGAVGPLQHKGMHLGADGRVRIFAQAPEAIRKSRPGFPVYTDARSYDEFVEMVRKAAPREVVLRSRLAFFCAMFRTEVVREVGPLDPRFLCGYDDNDYCLRIHESGRTCAVAIDTVLYHACGASFERHVDDYEERLAEDRERFRRKHGLRPDLPDTERAAA